MGKNIFLFEAKRQRADFFLWTAAITAALWGLTIGVYPIFEESADEMKKVMAGFPPQFAAAFSIDTANLFSFGGFYSFCFSYLGVMGAIMASSLALSIFSRERRAKCSDFLFTRPVSRGRAFCCKLLAGLALLALSNAVYLAAAAAIGRKNGTPLLLAGLSLFFTQLVFFALGTFYAVFAKKVRSVSGAATVFGFGAFLMTALLNLTGEAWLRYLAPLKYFEPAYVFAEGGYEFKYAITGLFVGAAGTLCAYLRYTKSDVSAA